MKKNDNKGFSLVELIIVIAIMVILVVAIAPQYLKFVHNAKISTDVQTGQQMVTDISTAIANGDSITISNYTSLPSKLGGTWAITYDAISGVSKITISGVTNGNGKTSYEIFPNPDNTTDGVNQPFNGVGLKK